jgi:hypothetical protein
MVNIEKKIIIAIMYLMKRLPDDFPFERIVSMIEDVLANESFLALESLCSNIDDYEIQITQNDYTRISGIINLIRPQLSDELANEYLELIQQHVVSS